ncbi:MAG: thymidine phosphorylase [Proteobacteria bacterium]|nr:thymidine phosphorylase [Pseudomonadota bacterium]
MLLPQEIIRRKRDGESLTPEEIVFMVRGLTDQSISEGQVAAFAMAVFFQGMSMDECVILTREMTHSGSVLDWSGLDLPGPVLDKHSTGGVGDKVSLMLAPIVAACGGFVPMISGRGLGHTGGTLDKLDSIPGYVTTPDNALFRTVVADTGCAIIGQTADLAPADRRFYAIRDVTATVESVPLITASILSKKLAAGLQGLVMDVKTGSGAFAVEEAMAEQLARSIVSVANGAGLETVALITDMDQVLGRTVGNALEVGEAVDYLTGKGQRDSRLHAIVMALAADMLTLGGITDCVEDGRRKAEQALDSTAAAAHFARMVAALGGPTDFLEAHARRLPAAPLRIPCLSHGAGVISAVDARAVGVAVVGLGGGRRRAGDDIDHAVGLSEVRGIGDRVGPDRPLAMIHARDEAAADAAIAQLRAAFAVADSAPQPAPMVRQRITGENL